MKRLCLLLFTPLLFYTFLQIGHVDTLNRNTNMASFLDIIHTLTSKLGGGAKTLPSSPTVSGGGYSPNGSSMTGNIANPLSGNLGYAQPLSTLDTSGNPTGNYSRPITPTQPDTSALQGNVRNRISSIQNAYDSLTGNIDQIVNERAGQYNQNYDQQLGNLSNAYQTNANQLGGAYGARGLGDSSFYGNAQTDAGNIYNQNVGSILQDKSNTFGQLGQYAQSAKAQYGAGKNAYNDVLGQLGQFDSSQLGDLYNQLGTQLGNVQSQAGGIGTNASFVDALNKITPTQNQGTSQLASKLQQLVTSGAPQFAKSQIAQGLIKQAQLTDPNAVSYWNDYYQKLLGGQA